MPKGVFKRTDTGETLLLLGAACWLKQEFETDTAFHRFTVYRDLGPERTLEKVREKLGKKPSYSAQIQKWSRKNAWVRRVEAYDAEQDRLRLEAETKEKIIAARKTIKEMAATAEALWKLAARDLENWHLMLQDEKAKAAKEKRRAKPALSPADLQRLADTGMKLHRLAMGEPDSIQEQRHELTVEEKRKRAQAIYEDPDARKAMQVVARKLGERFVLDVKTGAR